MRAGAVILACCMSSGWAMQAGDQAGRLPPPIVPVVVVSHDNTVITQSCQVKVADGAVIEDVDGNGVIQIAADGITVVFDPDSAALVGAADSVPYEKLTGVGIQIDGYHDVTLMQPRVHRFKVGIRARHADGLRIERADVSDGYAMKLGSTPQAEDAGDWLWPHKNDEGQWIASYGAGVAIEQSSGVTLVGTRARRRQNGIVLDRVRDSKIYDSDCSFLSGWGLAMWRSSGNVITRNAFDFCVRGYSDGVYNRGQDSAGILVFEQCSDNLFAQNSATHCGDGFFCFAGKEALGEKAAPEGFSYERKGCNDNLIIDNDFSYAAAHGLELTFGFGNRVIHNTLSHNGICGIWGGYSKEMLIAANTLEDNGQLGYGHERGGVNIEHGADNVIRDNRFKDNACGVFLWWDDDGALLKGPWAKANGAKARNNAILKNRFEGDVLGIELDGTEGTQLGGNVFDHVGEKIKLEHGASPREVMVTMEIYQPPVYEALGESRPVGGRTSLGGREAIVMGSYFPWDHHEPMARMRSRSSGVHAYEVFGDVKNFYVVINGEKIEFRMTEPRAGESGPYVVELSAPPGVHPYKVRLRGDDFEAVFEDTLIVAHWKAVFFPWTVDPREDVEGWRAEADSPLARSATLDTLDLNYGNKGPRDMAISPVVSAAGPGGDHFGMIAKTTMRLGAGRWRLTTLSDDGVRVLVDGKPVIENWTWHGPTRDSGEIVLDEPRAVEIVVEHFEIDGNAVLQLNIEKVGQ